MERNVEHVAPPDIVQYLRVIAAIFVVLPLVVAPVDAASSDEWSSSRGDSQNSASIGPSSGGNGDLLWECMTNISLAADLSASRNSIIINFGSFISSIDIDGKGRSWTYSAGAGGNRLPPIIYDGVVYWGSFDRNLYAIDLELGSLRWKLLTEGNIEFSPALMNNKIYVATSDVNGLADDKNLLYSINPSSGEVLWKSWLGKEYGIGATTPVLAEGNMVFVGTYDSGMLSFDAESGHILWINNDEKHITGPPAHDGGIIYFSSSSTFYAVDSDTGKTIWKYETGGTIYSSPAISEEEVMFGSSDGMFYSLKRYSGRVSWTYDAESPIRSSPVVSGGTVYYADSSGEIYSHRIYDGSIRWKIDIGESVVSSPIAVDGRLLVAADDSRLLALDIGYKKANPLLQEDKEIFDCLASGEILSKNSNSKNTTSEGPPQDENDLAITGILLTILFGILGIYFTIRYGRRKNS